MVQLRFCIPVVHGRGAGLGNELIPWARAFLMSQVLNAYCFTPAFGLNSRNYHRHFKTSRLDFAWQRLLTGALPRVHFDEAAFEAHGGHDAVEAFTSFAKAHDLMDRKPLVVTTDGLWGSIHHVARARDFIRAQLYNTTFALRNLALLGTRLDPDKLTVAMHVRLGDFRAPTEDISDYRGKFNATLPVDWFLVIGEKLKKLFGKDLQFQIFSDDKSEQLLSLHKVLQPINTHTSLPSDVSDLLAMSRADLLICSVSSYSIWAAALSQSPYVWFAPQMHPHSDAWVSIWGSQPSQADPKSPTQSALAQQAGTPSASLFSKGYAVGMDGRLSESLIHSLMIRIEEKKRKGDLVRCGVSRLI